MFKLRIALLAALATCIGGGAIACGEQTDCEIDDRTYRVFQPADTSGRAIIFFHGVGGQASKYITNDKLRAVAENLNATLITAQSAQQEWNVPGAPADYNAGDTTELEYFDHLQTDISSRFGITPEQTIVAGFSSGSMVVWNIACFRGQNAFGFVAVSGTFWNPMPSSCSSTPVKLIHYHGISDQTVTLEGGPVFDSHQGNVLQAIEMLAGTGIDQNRVDRNTADLECSTARSSASNHTELCFFEGGHRFNADYIKDAWDVFSG